MMDTSSRPYRAGSRGTLRFALALSAFAAWSLGARAALADQIPLLRIELAGVPSEVVAGKRPRAFSVGVTTPVVDRIKAQRAVYRNGQLKRRDAGPELNPPRADRASAGMTVAVGRVEFTPADAAEDGYYVEVIELLGEAGSRSLGVLASTALYYKVQGGQITPLTQRQYSSEQAPAFEAIDAQGRAVRGRNAAAEPIRGNPMAPVFLQPEPEVAP